MRGATVSLGGKDISYNFNPRTPCGVRQHFLVCFHPERGISIHAPHAGCDNHGPASRMRFSTFQSTHPMRGATIKTIISGHSTVISIHAPHAGCDADTDAPKIKAINFNPRTPCGVRRRPAPISTARPTFQSTHPMRGATENHGRDQAVQAISIHAPHAGCDSK